jgi:hypothetical protein
MPRSSHRRNAGGKSLHHPGRERSRRLLAAATLAKLKDRYFEDYLDAFNREKHPECDYADELLTLVAEGTFDRRRCRFHPASKAELFEFFVSPLDELGDGSLHIRTPEEADTAFRYLVKTEMIVVDGDVVLVHPRFGYLEAASMPQHMYPVRNR